jgi:hypothetical protein
MAAGNHTPSANTPRRRMGLRLYDHTPRRPFQANTQPISSLVQVNGSRPKNPGLIGRIP